MTSLILILCLGIGLGISFGVWCMKRLKRIMELAFPPVWGEDE